MKNSSRLLATLIWVYLGSGVFFVQTGKGEIHIAGLKNQRVYKDSVSFTVSTEDSSLCSAILNGETVPINTPVVVDRPDYYELWVTESDHAGHILHQSYTQFIVRASSRGNSEWGLPLHTPSPPIHSASEEFLDASLRLIAPSHYPPGLDIPIIVQVADGVGRRLGVNGQLILLDYPQKPVQVLRGVGSTCLPGVAEPGIVSLHAALAPLSLQEEVLVERDTPWQTLSQDILETTEWPAHARIHITNVKDDHLLVGSEALLTIKAGTVVLVDPDITIEVQGQLSIEGSLTHPVVFATKDRNQPWGGFVFKSPDAQADITGAIFIASGADPRWFKNHPGHGGSHRKGQCLFYLSNQARVTLQDSFMIDNHSQIAHGENSTLKMNNCLVQRCQTLGQFNGGSVRINNCALIEFPQAGLPYKDADNDAIYLTKGEHEITDSLIGWCLDDGIDAGGGAMDNSWYNDVGSRPVTMRAWPYRAPVSK